MPPLETGSVADHRNFINSERERVIALEASRRIPADLKAKYTEIPSADIAGFGNILRHGYDSFDHAVIWSVVENDLPPLKAAVEAMLKEIDGKVPRRRSSSASASSVPFARTRPNCVH